MQITRVDIAVRDPRGTATFLSEVLELPTSSTTGGSQVRVGSTRLELRTDTEIMGEHHLAFLIPDSSFESAERLLVARVELLSGDGGTAFEGPVGWNSRSLYFEAPDGTVLELIGRRDHSTPRRGTGPADVLSISEVGVAVPDVPATTRALAADFGIPPYAQDAPGQDFSPVGHADGMLILVSPGRVWSPTATRIAHEQALTVHAVGRRPGRFRLTDSAELILIAEE